MTIHQRQDTLTEAPFSHELVLTLVATLLGVLALKVSPNMLHASIPATLTRKALAAEAAVTDGGWLS
jgi:hypothetical protein